ncbi:MAG: hypothetical protein WCX33_01205 [Candidatus Shapirobacteria bacterium]
MNPRKKILIFFGITYLILASFIFFGLKFYSQKNSSKQKIEAMIIGESKFKDKTTNLCQYQILGEPKVGKDYIKINFWCNDGSKARSTFALKAFSDQSVNGIIKEYARIIGFDYNIIQEKNWVCKLNDQEITSKTSQNNVTPANTIDCFENKGTK